MSVAAQQVVSETTREILQRHILTALRSAHRPLARGRLINRLPCGFTNAEALDALEALAADGQITVTPSPDSSEPDFAIIALA